MNLTLQTIPSTTVSELLARSKMNGVVLDTEHGAFNNETLFNCIQVITSLNKRCFVRVTYLDRRLVKMCLDAGCDGLIFSTVESGEQAKQILDYCNYPKQGGKRGCGLVRENNWSVTNCATKKPILMAQIETKKGVDSIEDILVFGFDYYIIGPYDLSSSLGCAADWENKLYKDYINKICSKIASSDLGMFFVYSDKIDKALAETLGVSIFGMDALFIKESIENIASEINIIE